MEEGHDKQDRDFSRPGAFQAAESSLIGHAVRDARKKRGWSQTDLARNASPGVEQTAISRIERGETLDPSVVLIYRIAKALGVTVESLVANTIVIPSFADSNYGEGAYTESRVRQQELDEAPDPQIQGLEQRIASVEDKVAELAATTTGEKIEDDAELFSEITVRAYAGLIETHIYDDERKKKLHDAFDAIGEPNSAGYSIRFMQAEIETLRALVDFLINKNDDHNTSFSHIGQRISHRDVAIITPAVEPRESGDSADEVKAHLAQQGRKVAKVLRAAFRVLNLRDPGVEAALQALEERAPGL